MNNIEQIIEEPDAIVLLRFCSFHEPTNLASTSPSRKSSFDFHSDRGIPIKKPQTCRFKSPIAEPVINDPPSPSSPGIGYGYNVLTNSNFTIDWRFHKEDYYSTSNASKHQCFEEIDRNLRGKIKNECIADMQKVANSFSLSIV